mgnify:CR=1 FL=1
MGILNIENVSKSFGSRRVLDSVSLSLERGETLALIGPSGEGKSTLLRICALLERADSGAVEYDGLYACKDGRYAGKAELAACRARLGMVFQSFELFPHRSVIQNICDAPVVVQHRDANEVRQEGSALLARVGLAGREDAMPYQLSGGEKQRAAVARAIITDPRILLADEPTGALDSKSSKRLLDNFAQLNSQGKTILMVTHSAFAASYASRVLFIRDGGIFSQIYRAEESNAAFFDRIVSNLSVLSEGGNGLV